MREREREVSDGHVRVTLLRFSLFFSLPLPLFSSLVRAFDSTSRRLLVSTYLVSALLSFTIVCQLPFSSLYPCSPFQSSFFISFFSSFWSFSFLSFTFTFLSLCSLFSSSFIFRVFFNPPVHSLIFAVRTPWPRESTWETCARSSPSWKRRRSKRRSKNLAGKSSTRKRKRSGGEKGEGRERSGR